VAHLKTVIQFIRFIRQFQDITDFI